MSGMVFVKVLKPFPLNGLVGLTGSQVVRAPHNLSEPMDEDGEPIPAEDRTRNGYTLYMCNGDSQVKAGDMVFISGPDRVKAGFAVACDPETLEELEPELPEGTLANPPDGGVGEGVDGDGEGGEETPSEPAKRGRAKAK